MATLIQRTYTIASAPDDVPHSRDADSASSGAHHHHHPPPPSSAPTRTLRRRWCHYDPLTGEGGVVSLYTHRTRHALATGPDALLGCSHDSHSPETMPHATRAAGNGWVEWELMHLPGTVGPAAPPTRPARGGACRSFFVDPAQATPSVSTVAGTSGVVFLSARVVLIDTGVANGVSLDAFCLVAASALSSSSSASSGADTLWHRVPAGVPLPTSSSSSSSSSLHKPAHGSSCSRLTHPLRGDDAAATTEERPHATTTATTGAERLVHFSAICSTASATDRPAGKDEPRWQRVATRAVYMGARRTRNGNGNGNGDGDGDAGRGSLTGRVDLYDVWVGLVDITAAMDEAGGVSPPPTQTDSPRPDKWTGLFAVQLHRLMTHTDVCFDRVDDPDATPAASFSSFSAVSPARPSALAPWDCLWASIHAIPRRRVQDNGEAGATIDPDRRRRVAMGEKKAEEEEEEEEALLVGVASPRRGGVRQLALGYPCRTGGADSTAPADAVPPVVRVTVSRQDRGLCTEREEEEEEEAAEQWLSQLAPPFEPLGPAPPTASVRSIAPSGAEEQVGRKGRRRRRGSMRWLFCIRCGSAAAAAAPPDEATDAKAHDAAESAVSTRATTAPEAAWPPVAGRMYRVRLAPMRRAPGCTIRWHGMPVCDDDKILCPPTSPTRGFARSLALGAVAEAQDGMGVANKWRRVAAVPQYTLLLIEPHRGRAPGWDSSPGMLWSCWVDGGASSLTGCCPARWTRWAVAVPLRRGGRATEAMQRVVRLVTAVAPKIHSDSCQIHSDSCQHRSDSCQSHTNSCQRRSDSCQRRSDSCERHSDSCQRRSDSCERRSDSCECRSFACQRRSDSCQSHSGLCESRRSLCKYRRSLCEDVGKRVEWLARGPTSQWGAVDMATRRAPTVAESASRAHNGDGTTAMGANVAQTVSAIMTCAARAESHAAHTILAAAAVSARGPAEAVSFAPAVACRANRVWRWFWRTWATTAPPASRETRCRTWRPRTHGQRSAWWVTRLTEWIASSQPSATDDDDDHAGAGAGADADADAERAGVNVRWFLQSVLSEPTRKVCTAAAAAAALQRVAEDVHRALLLLLVEMDWTAGPALEEEEDEPLTVPVPETTMDGAPDRRTGTDELVRCLLWIYLGADVPCAGAEEDNPPRMDGEWGHVGGTRPAGEAPVWAERMCVRVLCEIAARPYRPRDTMNRTNHTTSSVCDTTGTDRHTRREDALHDCTNDGAAHDGGTDCVPHGRCRVHGTMGTCEGRRRRSPVRHAGAERADLSRREDNDQKEKEEGGDHRSQTRGAYDSQDEANATRAYDRLRWHLLLYATRRRWSGGGGGYTEVLLRHVVDGYLPQVGLVGECPADPHTPRRRRRRRRVVVDDDDRDAVEFALLSVVEPAALDAALDAMAATWSAGVGARRRLGGNRQREAVGRVGAMCCDGVSLSALHGASASNATAASIPFMLCAMDLARSVVTDRWGVGRDDAMGDGYTEKDDNNDDNNDAAADGEKEKEEEEEGRAARRVEELVADAVARWGRVSPTPLLPSSRWLREAAQGAPLLRRFPWCQLGDGVVVVALHTLLTHVSTRVHAESVRRRETVTCRRDDTITTTDRNYIKTPHGNRSNRNDGDHTRRSRGTKPTDEIDTQDIRHDPPPPPPTSHHHHHRDGNRGEESGEDPCRRTMQVHHTHRTRTRRIDGEGSDRCGYPNEDPRDTRTTRSRTTRRVMALLRRVHQSLSVVRWLCADSSAASAAVFGRALAREERAGGVRLVDWAVLLHRTTDPPPHHRAHRSCTDLLPRCGRAHEGWHARRGGGNVSRRTAVVLRAWHRMMHPMGAAAVSSPRRQMLLRCLTYAWQQQTQTQTQQQQQQTQQTQQQRTQQQQQTQTQQQQQQTQQQTQQMQQTQQQTQTHDPHPLLDKSSSSFLTPHTAPVLSLSWFLHVWQHLWSLPHLTRDATHSATQLSRDVLDVILAWPTSPLPVLALLAMLRPAMWGAQRTSWANAEEEPPAVCCTAPPASPRWWRWIAPTWRAPRRRRRRRPDSGGAVVWTATLARTLQDALTRLTRGSAAEPRRVAVGLRALGRLLALVPVVWQHDEEPQTAVRVDADEEDEDEAAQEEHRRTRWSPPERPCRAGVFHLSPRTAFAVAWAVMTSPPAADGSVGAAGVVLVCALVRAELLVFVTAQRRAEGDGMVTTMQQKQKAEEKGAEEKGAEAAAILWDEDAPAPDRLRALSDALKACRAALAAVHPIYAHAVTLLAMDVLHECLLRHTETGGWDGDRRSGRRGGQVSLYCHPVSASSMGVAIAAAVRHEWAAVGSRAERAVLTMILLHPPFGADDGMSSQRKAVAPWPDSKRMREEEEGEGGDGITTTTTTPTRRQSPMYAQSRVGGAQNTAHASSYRLTASHRCARRAGAAVLARVWRVGEWEVKGWGRDRWGGASWAHRLCPAATGAPTTTTTRSSSSRRASELAQPTRRCATPQDTKDGRLPPSDGEGGASGWWTRLAEHVAPAPRAPPPPPPPRRRRCRRTLSNASRQRPNDPSSNRRIDAAAAAAAVSEAKDSHTFMGSHPHGHSIDCHTTPLNGGDGTADEYHRHDCTNKNNSTSEANQTVTGNHSMVIPTREMRKDEAAVYAVQLLIRHEEVRRAGYQRRVAQCLRDQLEQPNHLLAQALVTLHLARRCDTRRGELLQHAVGQKDLFFTFASMEQSRLLEQARARQVALVQLTQAQHRQARRALHQCEMRGRDGLAHEAVCAWGALTASLRLWWQVAEEESMVRAAVAALEGGQRDWLREEEAEAEARARARARVVVVRRVAAPAKATATAKVGRRTLGQVERVATDAWYTNPTQRWEGDGNRPAGGEETASERQGGAGLGETRERSIMAMNTRTGTERIDHNTPGDALALPRTTDTAEDAAEEDAAAAAYESHTEPEERWGAEAASMAAHPDGAPRTRAHTTAASQASWWTTLGTWQTKLRDTVAPPGRPPPPPRSPRSPPSSSSSPHRRHSQAHAPCAASGSVDLDEHPVAKRGGNGRVGGLAREDGVQEHRGREGPLWHTPDDRHARGRAHTNGGEVETEESGDEEAGAHDDGTTRLVGHAMTPLAAPDGVGSDSARATRRDRMACRGASDLTPFMEDAPPVVGGGAARTGDDVIRPVRDDAVTLSSSATTTRRVGGASHTQPTAMERSRRGGGRRRLLATRLGAEPLTGQSAAPWALSTPEDELA